MFPSSNPVNEMLTGNGKEKSGLPLVKGSPVLRGKLLSSIRQRNIDRKFKEKSKPACEGFGTQLRAGGSSCIKVSNSNLDFPHQVPGQLALTGEQMMKKS
ncbi:hypothetical protein Nepgr_021788 [Nepenthes gracilis]|uniref:Uncharacterized protein n=1 Tax=Nepenthes gracilis TaxID=150966 RepID=A0AAD3XW80_NEPGR|nr:hypothetical protein Nepgr_021788 [Nepenthes gracilis]